MLDLVADRGSSNTDCLTQLLHAEATHLVRVSPAQEGVHKILPQLPTLTKLSEQPVGAEEVGT